MYTINNHDILSNAEFYSSNVKAKISLHCKKEIEFKHFYVWI